MAHTSSEDGDRDELERLRLETIFYLAKLEMLTSPEPKRDRPQKLSREERIRWYRRYLLIKYGLPSKQASDSKPIDVQSTYMCPCRLVPIRRYTHE